MQLADNPSLLRGAAESDSGRTEIVGRIIESVPHAMLMLDPNGTIQLANAPAEKLFGYERNALIGSPAVRLLPERMRAPSSTQGVRFFADPKLLVGGELFGLRSDGSEIAIEITLDALADSEAPTVLASIVEISERRQAAHDRTDAVRLL